MFDKFVPKKNELTVHSNTWWAFQYWVGPGFFSITVRMGFWGKKIQNEISTTPNYFKNLIDWHPSPVPIFYNKTFINELCIIILKKKKVLNYFWIRNCITLTYFDSVRASESCHIFFKSILFQMVNNILCHLYEGYP